MSLSLGETGVLRMLSESDAHGLTAICFCFDACFWSTPLTNTLGSSTSTHEVPRLKQAELRLHLVGLWIFTRSMCECDRDASFEGKLESAVQQGTTRRKLVLTYQDPDAARAHPDGSRHGGLPGVVEALRCSGRFAGQQRAASESRCSGFRRRGSCGRGDQAAGSERRWTAGAGLAQGSQDIGCPQGFAPERGACRKAGSGRTG